MTGPSRESNEVNRVGRGSAAGYLGFAACGESRPSRASADEMGSFDVPIAVVYANNDGCIDKTHIVSFLPRYGG